MEITRIVKSDLDFYALLTLLVVLISSYNKDERKFLNYKLFISMLLSTIMVLFFEGVMWLIDGRLGSVWRELNVVVSTLFLTLNPIPPLLWVSYADYQLHENKQRVGKILKVLGSLTVIHAFMVLLSPTFKFIYYIDEANIYHRGDLLWLTATICYVLLAYALIIILRNRKTVDHRRFYALLLFSIPPFFGGIVQIFFYGVSTLWPGVALSLILIFINIQNNEMNTDFLTGVFNRKRFESHLEMKIKESLSKNKLFALLILDLDKFKEINDNYGHHEGDLALETAARILKDSLRQNDFIARYAGDEFAVLLDTGSKSVLEEIVRRIKDNFEYHNMNSYVKYEISFSIGYDIYDNEKKMNLEDYFMYIDKLMYKEKKKKKSKETTVILSS